MDTPWLAALATALQEDDEGRLFDRARGLLGDGARVATWAPVRTGWVHAHGDDLPLPDDLPTTPGTVGTAGCSRSGSARTRPPAASSP